MKFIPMTDKTCEPAVLKADFDTAKAFAKAKVGEQCFFYPAGLCKRSYVPYESVVWAFRRQEEMSRAGQAFTVNKLVLVTGDKKQLEFIIHKDGAQLCFDKLKEKKPGVDIGYEKDKEEKYL